MELHETGFHLHNAPPREASLQMYLDEGSWHQCKTNRATGNSSTTHRYLQSLPAFPSCKKPQAVLQSQPEVSAVVDIKGQTSKTFHLLSSGNLNTMPSPPPSQPAPEASCSPGVQGAEGKWTQPHNSLNLHQKP